MPPPTLTPTPNPSPQGGGEHTESAAPLVSSSRQQLIPLRLCPGCGAARSGAPLIRDRYGLELTHIHTGWNGPGSAAHHFASAPALRPGHANLRPHPPRRDCFFLPPIAIQPDTISLYTARPDGDAVAAGAMGQGSPWGRAAHEIVLDAGTRPEDQGDGGGGQERARDRQGARRRHQPQRRDRPLPTPARDCLRVRTS